MKTFRILLGLLIFSALPAFALDPQRIVVVANATDPKSMKIAKHYLEARQIPQENLFLLECPTVEAITWDVFIETVFNPLRRQLFEAGWIEGSLSEQTDKEGRFQVVSMGNRMDFLVVCRIPLRIKNDEVRLQRLGKQNVQAQFAVNRASVDAELALLVVSDTPIIGFVPNPLFRKRTPRSIDLQQVVRVARLDGPSVADSTALVDRALEAEQKGLRGRAYIDLSGRRKGDDWFKEAGQRIESLDFSVTWDSTRSLMGYDQRFDAPAFYFGWWKPIIEGPPAERDFRFPPGAMGWHLHSFSAAVLRNKDIRWTGPLIARGLTATVGNVFEPYLELTHRPQDFIEGIAQGMSAGEAAYYALPALSWMAVFVGDPLYQPLTTDLDSQIKKLEPTDPLSQYVVIRGMNRLRSKEGQSAALAYGKRYFHQAPGLALGFEIAKILVERGESEQAVSYLATAALLPEYAPEDQGLAFNVAQLLWRIQQRKLAFSLMEALASSSLSQSAICTYYPLAIQWAKALGAQPQVNAWSAELNTARVEAAAKKSKG